MHKDCMLMRGIEMSNLKLVMVILAFGLLCFMGTAAAIPHHDWNSPHGIGPVHHSDWWQPVTYHNLYSPAYYNAFDPWWNLNVYGPLRTTYYRYSWRW